MCRYFFVSYKTKSEGYGDMSIKSDKFFNSKQFREEIEKELNLTGVIITFILEMNKEDFEDFYRD